jgi:hypothetical protein
MQGNKHIWETSTPTSDARRLRRTPREPSRVSSRRDHVLVSLGDHLCGCVNRSETAAGAGDLVEPEKGNAIT